MSMQCNSNLPRAISVADFILEDTGHSVAETAEEFGLGKTAIEHDINCLGACAFYGNLPNKKELQQKYIDVKLGLLKNTMLKISQNIICPTKEQLQNRSCSFISLQLYHNL